MWEWQLVINLFQAYIILFVLYLLVDTQAPVVSNCPTNTITSTLPVGTSVVTVSWTEPTANDNSQLQVQVDQTNSPGQFFRQGSEEVVYTFRDSVNNVAECRFMVVVTGKEGLIRSSINNSWHSWCNHHIYWHSTKQRMEITNSLVLIFQFKYTPRELVYQLPILRGEKSSEINHVIFVLLYFIHIQLPEHDLEPGKMMTVKQSEHDKFVHVLDVTRAMISLFMFWMSLERCSCVCTIVLRS